MHMCTQTTQSVGFMRDKMIQFPGNESDALQMCFFSINQSLLNGFGCSCLFFHSAFIAALNINDDEICKHAMCLNKQMSSP